MDSWNPKIIGSPNFSDRMIMDYHTSMGGQATGKVWLNIDEPPVGNGDSSI